MVRQVHHLITLSQVEGQITTENPNPKIDCTKEGLLSLRIVENGLSYSSRIISEGTLRVLGLLAASPTTVIGFVFTFHLLFVCSRVRL
jgi:hypothetical protein